MRLSQRDHTLAFTKALAVQEEGARVKVRMIDCLCFPNKLNLPHLHYFNFGVSGEKGLHKAYDRMSTTSGSVERSAELDRDDRTSKRIDGINARAPFARSMEAKRRGRLQQRISIYFDFRFNH